MSITGMLSSREMSAIMRLKKDKDFEFYVNYLEKQLARRLDLIGVKTGEEGFKNSGEIMSLRKNLKVIETIHEIASKAQKI